MPQTPGTPTPTDAGPRPEAHAELILRRVEALPTLSPVAARVMSLSGSGDAELGEIAALIESDPALAAKVLSLSRRSHRGAGAVMTVPRAVVMLGLEAVRAAVLSIEVFGLLSPGPGEEHDLEREDDAQPRVDRRGMWINSIGVACAAELLAERAEGDDAPDPGEAYLCGLLHAIGKIALDRIMPRSFARAVAISEARGADLAEVERRVIGLDHAGVGKRLAEHWRLPHAVQDAAWLTAGPPGALPDVPHAPTLRAVIAARALARRFHVGWSGVERPAGSIGALLRAAGVPGADPDALAPEIEARAHARAATLGLLEDDDPSLLMQAVGRANAELGRLSSLLAAKATDAERQRHALAAIAEFHLDAARRGDLGGALGAVAASATDLLGGRVAGALWQPRPGAPCEVHALASDGRLTGTTFLEGDASPRSLASVLPAPACAIADGTSLGGAASAVRRGDEPLYALALAHGEEDAGVGALIVEGRAPEGAPAWLEAARAAWGAALSGAAQHDGARRVSEELVDANRALGEANAKLVDAESMLRIAEVAAGAAHEMNNPLTVISGHAQSLLQRASHIRDRRALERVVESTERLSALLSDLHFFARPPAPRYGRVSVQQLVHESITAATRRLRAEPRDARARAGITRGSDTLVRASVEPGLPAARLDLSQIALALTELLLNAAQSHPRSRIELRVHVETGDDRLVISVVDDGTGMSERTLAHAFDPFFSEKPAGRRTGLGLAKARRLVELHGGEIDLQSAPGEGTSARIALPAWRWEADDLEASEAA